MTTVEKTYDPKQVEQKWYTYWQENGYFHQEVDAGKEPFCVVIPPPNVTGQLHMGHALDNTYQDILVRWKRMQGLNTIWIPGTDHAGIATQARVESHIRATEGKTRHELGREEFLKRTWAWKEDYGNQILNQLKKLGASLDWERERFTMDEGCSRAVREVFVRLFDKGLIYQGNYSVNWCPNCATTLSDIEVEHEDQTGQLYHVKYPFSDGSGFIEIATTRPETMLGDTAIAVNPADERYKHLLGKTVTVPLVDRQVPIVADEYVDLDFGTGMVKITPAHDPNDFEIGLRHNLAQIQVIGLDAQMTTEAGKYAGLDRYEARRQILRDLEELGLLVKVEDHDHAVGQCYRCNTVVEPVVSKQWFVKMEPLAKSAIAAVENGEIRFVPERFNKHYLRWMENLRDWCISRQLWWGHRIPVWYCVDCGKVFASVDEPTQCPACDSERIEQDPDVLDTWFSSALWPFSTLGWPDETAELGHFYPTAVLITGFDIIFFWVARMIVMGYEFMGDRPFSEVLIHGLVRDAQGRKMSKSLNNGVDPLDAIDQYGADALRFNLVIGVAPGNDMRYMPEKVEAYRNFANKIWNASRFALMNLTDFNHRKQNMGSLELTTTDHWILSRYEFTAKEVTRFLERYDVGEGARVLYEFLWNELCDWYIELVKPRLYGKQGEESRYVAQYTLWYVLRGTLELLHPYMPFITEEIWQNLPHEGDSIMLAPWPEPEGLASPADEKTMNTIMAIITEIRTLRSEKNVPPGRKITAICQGSQGVQELLAAAEQDILNLAGLETLIMQDVGQKPAKALSAVVDGVNIFLPLADLVDMEAEIERTKRDLEQTELDLERAQSKLQNEGFITKAPPQVVDKEREKVESYRATAERLKSLLQEMQG
ncbi:MAG: valine--tRNA ligase [Limnochordia bacterium]|nr:valine--tRNA ligase [Limnochordia bacterium]